MFIVGLFSDKSFSFFNIIILWSAIAGARVLLEMIPFCRNSVEIMDQSANSLHRHNAISRR